MGLFLHEITEASKPKRELSNLAAASLIVAVTGFLNLIGFFAAPVLAHLALVRIRDSRRRGVTLAGRGLAIAALWVSYGAIFAALLTFAIILTVAYAALPRPRFF